MIIPTCCVGMICTGYAYTIHRIFIYRPKTADFEEVQPDCGDGFVNLRVDKKRKVLLSTYWGMDGPQSCVTRFHKR